MYPHVSLLDAPLIARMRKIGMLMPWRTLSAARDAHIPIELACSLLMQESAGGKNIFGHDPTIFVGAGVVTKAKYLAYKAMRGPKGQGGMQGVGPCQLTFWSLQDAADEAGGCWDPLPNMSIGFHTLAENIRQSGLHAGVAAYNGSGPAASKYADQVIARANLYRKALGV